MHYFSPALRIKHKPFAFLVVTFLKNLNHLYGIE